VINHKTKIRTISDKIESMKKYNVILTLWLNC